MLHHYDHLVKVTWRLGLLISLTFLMNVSRSDEPRLASAAVDGFLVSVTPLADGDSAGLSFLMVFRSIDGDAVSEVYRLAPDEPVTEIVASSSLSLLRTRLVYRVRSTANGLWGEKLTGAPVAYGTPQLGVSAQDFERRTWAWVEDHPDCFDIRKVNPGDGVRGSIQANGKGSFLLSGNTDISFSAVFFEGASGSQPELQTLKAAIEADSKVGRERVVMEFQRLTPEISAGLGELFADVAS